MARELIEILLVEGRAAEVERTKSLLETLPDVPAKVHRVTDSNEAETYLRAEQPALMVLIMETARAGADRLVAGLRTKFTWLPILVVATDSDQDAAEGLIRSGAQECLREDELLPSLLASSIRHAQARHAAETALRANEELMRLVAENTTDLIAVLDRAGRRVFNSPSYARTFGDSTDLAGTDSFGEIHPEDREKVQQLFQRTLQTGEGGRVEFRLQLPGGAVRWLQSVGSAIRDARGRPDRVVVVSHDLTEKNGFMEGLDRTVAELRNVNLELSETRRQLSQAEKLGGVSTFAEAIAHDVKNALQRILLGLDFLKTMLPEDEGTNRVLQELSTAARQTDGAVASLLGSVENVAIEASLQDLNVLVEQCVAGVQAEAESKRVQVERKLASHLPLVEIDAFRFRHLLMRILSDAVAATPKQGVVRVSTSQRSATLAGALESSAKPALALVVIEDEVRSSSSDPSTESAGSGDLGDQGPRQRFDASTWRKVAERIDGRLEVSSRPSGGRNVTLTFKAEPAGEKAVEETVA